MGYEFQASLRHSLKTYLKTIKNNKQFNKLELGVRLIHTFTVYYGWYILLTATLESQRQVDF